MRSLLIGLSLGLITACYPKSAPPPGVPTASAVTAAQARWPDTTEASLTEGRSLFIANCNKCHDYPDLHALDAQKLEHEVREMAHDKAHLNDVQTEQVVRFALTAHDQPG